MATSPNQASSTGQQLSTRDDDIDNNNNYYYYYYYNNNRSSCFRPAPGLCLLPCTRCMAEFGPRQDVLMVLPTYSRTGSPCQASTDRNISTGTDAKPEMAMDEIASQGAVDWQTD
ncbi:hypothetical protein CTAM01_11962 [Colletotrichum tamarilloi]|uniref:Uncharacterized protein n=1 Tax=Colletotrichum tamarilloi TaxID=1209934 RepID=A0ABQ9QW17_9PEZI|nr:uncharacterized protein CTAM01_11962 [Colletotrichum tamarilloi]KAK1487029.1 hypothetical protein CTAM01_11962 [Colletotrichum tamarilloi]